VLGAPGHGKRTAHLGHLLSRDRRRRPDRDRLGVRTEPGGRRRTDCGDPVLPDYGGLRLQLLRHFARCARTAGDGSHVAPLRRRRRVYLALPLRPVRGPADHPTEPCAGGPALRRRRDRLARPRDNSVGGVDHPQPDRVGAGCARARLHLAELARRPRRGAAAATWALPRRRGVLHDRTRGVRDRRGAWS